MVKTAGDLLIYLGCVAGALTAIGVVLRWAVVRPLRGFVRREVNMPLVEIRDQLAQYGSLSTRFDDHLATHHGVRHG